MSRGVFSLLAHLGHARDEGFFSAPGLYIIWSWVAGVPWFTMATRGAFLGVVWDYLSSKEGLMSFRTFSGGLPRRFRVVQQSFLQRDGLAFEEVLSEQDIQAAFDAEGVTFAQDEGDVYTPSVTLWAF